MTLSSASLQKKAAALAALFPIERLEQKALSFGVGPTFAEQAQRRRKVGARRGKPAARAESERAKKSAAPALVAAPVLANSAGQRSATVDAISSSSEPWAVALSGGADSVALLLLLWAHWPERRGDLLALHYNHRMRGAAADEDERFCQKLCRALGVKLAVGRAGEEGGEAGGSPAPPALRSEAQARDARFAFFSKKMAAARARLLWLGHQQNDVAETLLMRLTRGSGPSGLAAPRPVQVIRSGAEKNGQAAQIAGDTGGEEGAVSASRAVGARTTSRERGRSRAGVEEGRNENGGSGGASENGGRVHLRPLLTLARAEIEAALRRCEIPWREDATNAEGDFFRNRIRRDVLPALVAAAGGAGGRDALAGMALARELIDEDDTALDTWADEVFDLSIMRASVGSASPKGSANASSANCDDTLALDLRRLRVSPTSDTPKERGERPPRAVLRRVLHRWLRECAGAPTLSRQAFEALLTAVETGQSTRQSLGAGGFALIRRGILHFEPRPAAK